MSRKDQLIIEGARIAWRNFSGIGNEYNREGDRNFGIYIDDADTAIQMREAGWNIKTLTNDSDPEDVKYVLKKVIVKLDSNFPPKIFTVAPNGVVTQLEEEEVGELDQADIKYADVRINPSYWDRNGKSGITAYLETAYFVLEEDYLATKYAQQEYPREEDDVYHPSEMPLN